MTEPQMPPGLKLGPEVVRVSALLREGGSLAGVTVDAHAPRDVVIAVLKLALMQVQQLSPDAHGLIAVKTGESLGGSIEKRGMN